MKEEPDRGPPGLVSVYRTPDHKDCLDHKLVLQSMAIDSHVLVEGKGFSLVVNPRDEARARDQLALYRHENRDWMPRMDWTPLTTKPDWRNGVFLYVTVLLLVDFFQKTRWLGLDWLGAGKMDAGLVRQGEWWRCITALTLHADLSHLVGNVVFGALFGLLASQQLGMGLAWFAILVSGMLGNGLNAFVQAPKHTAIGASTAVFAALGILAGGAWTARRHHIHRSWIIRWAPIVSGLVLLAFLGTGGERTDITAHLTGFLSGGLFGVGFGLLGDRFELKPQFQGILGLSIFAILALAWLLALGGHGD